MGIKDPLRDGVQDAIRTLRDGGIKTIMVTGDNHETAIAISKEANIIPHDVPEFELGKYAVDGKTLRDMSDNDLDELLQTLCCVSRC